MTEQTPVTELRGIGEKTGRLFEKLQIVTVGELLAHYPREYETYEEPVAVSCAVPGRVCAVRVTVAGIPNMKKIRNLTILNVNVRDSSGGMLLTFFNMPFMKNLLKNGGTYIFRGLIQTRGGGKVMEQPKLFSGEDYAAQINLIQPRYPLTRGLTNLTVQKAVKQALPAFDFGEEYYPSWLTQRYGLLPVGEAVRGVHFPADYGELLQARRRMVFDEFFCFLLILRRNKDLVRQLPNEFPMTVSAEADRFLQELPFSLTGAQLKVWEEIGEDLRGAHSMNRLIQGDVGSGKTIVALLALLMCAENGHQGALMAPTEVLAAQHFETVSGYAAKFGLPVRPVLLTGSMSAGEKRNSCERLRTGEANLAVGTHALIQDRVEFASLALVVTDEQHRFGVRQRERLAGKGLSPHVLVMSATPIPRTLAIILYGDLHISVIDELPADRLPIKNCVVNTAYRPKAYAFIEKQVAEGRQAYVICPMVEEGELEDAENVEEYTGKLRAALPPSVRVAPLHGKMRPADKNRIMEEFSGHEIDVLVSTTVVEVGINVPNATVMMVENAERFGLAQLHQLRGRVGRGAFQSYCIFVSARENKETMERLEILNRSNDGFFIASEDLKLRGPGDLFGIRQSGDFSFRMGDIYADAGVLKDASEAVEAVLAQDPELEKPEHAPLRNHILSPAVAGVDFRTI